MSPTGELDQPTPRTRERLPRSRVRRAISRLQYRWRDLPGPLRKVVAAVVGCVLVVGGLLLLVLPGPGILTIAAGVAVLAAEFALPKRFLRWAMTRARTLRQRWRH